MNIPAAQSSAKESSTAAPVPTSALRSSGKRKHDEAGIDIQGNPKKQKGGVDSESSADKALTADSRSSTGASPASAETAKAPSTASKPPPDIRLVVKAQRGGEMDYVDRRKRYIAQHADAIADDIESRALGYGGFGILESFDDLDDADLDGMDVEGDMVRYKTEYDIAVQTKDGVEIGQVKLLAVDLSESEDFFDFFECFDSLSSNLADFSDLFDNEDVQSGGPLLDSRVHSSGKKCWSRREFTTGEPLVIVTNLEIKSGWRGQGVGSQVYATLSSLDQVRGSKYLFAKPGPVDLLPEDVDPRSPTVMDWIKRGHRVRAFHRHAGFRRIGNSVWYARSSDPAHPSRAIDPKKDAPFVPPGKNSKQDRLVAAIMFG